MRNILCFKFVSNIHQLTTWNTKVDFLTNARFENLTPNIALDSTLKKLLENAQKNHIYNLYELLLNPPKSYENRQLLPRLYNGALGTLNIQITQSTKGGFGKKTFLRVSAIASDFNQPLSLIIFHPKPFMNAQFSEGKQCVIYGKVEEKQGFFSIIQPRIVTDFGEVVMKFKTTPQKAKILQALAKCFISEKNLISCGINPPYTQRICEIFTPSDMFVQQFKSNGGLFGEYLDSIKLSEIIYYTLRLRKKKLHCNANFLCNGQYQSFIQSLPFTLTNGQQQAIQAIAHDLAQPKACRRLIMGDVGCGKTIVILSAVMMAYPKKSILMAPTSILAKQLYNEAKRLLPNSVNIALVTAQTKEGKKDTKTSKQKNNEMLSLFTQEDSNQAHFIIGTQAILYREFDFANFALVMSDEQHRFGTKQRHTLEKMFSGEDYAQNATRPHSLQFSATPIPRTMAMINAQFIDFSTIKDLPFKKDIQSTIITKAHFSTLIAHLKAEITKGNQALIIYPLVEESEHIDYLSLSQGQDFWRKHFDGVFVTSGKDKQKEEVLENFAKNGTILLATTVVEVGISLPKLSTIVIVAPERLGLATLHQLRGRVSRNGLKGYCFLYTNSNNTERLERFCQTLNGFEIAELDLQYRNSGDLLSGQRQSGEEFSFFNMQSDERILRIACELK